MLGTDICDFICQVQAENALKFIYYLVHAQHTLKIIKSMLSMRLRLLSA
jgi:hypothetical protein